MRPSMKRFLGTRSRTLFRLNFLEQFSAGIMLVLILLLFTMANLQAVLWTNSEWLVSSILPSVIVDLTNEERDAADLGQLVRSSTLDAAAQLKAEHMAKNSYFSHYSPDGVSPWHWFNKAGYNYLHAGENLAVHFTDSDQVVEAWMESPSHRANIMNGQYREIGVGTAKGEYKGYPTVFVVQLFGTERAETGTQKDVAVTPAQSVTVERVAIAAEETEVAQASIETPMAEETLESSSTDTPVVTSPSESTPTEETPVVSEQSTVVPVMITDLATTTREGVPAVVSPVGSGPELPLLLRGAATPSVWLSMLYSVLALIVVVSLFSSMLFEMHRRKPANIAYAGGLLTVMALLTYIHMSLTSHVIIL